MFDPCNVEKQGIFITFFSFYAIIAIEHVFSIHEHYPGSLGGVENRGLRYNEPGSSLLRVIRVKVSEGSV